MFPNLGIDAQRIPRDDESTTDNVKCKLIAPVFVCKAVTRPRVDKGKILSMQL